MLKKKQKKKKNFFLNLLQVLNIIQIKHSRAAITEVE